MRCSSAVTFAILDRHQERDWERTKDFPDSMPGVTDLTWWYWCGGTTGGAAGHSGSFGRDERAAEHLGRPLNSQWPEPLAKLVP